MKFSEVLLEYLIEQADPDFAFNPAADDGEGNLNDPNQPAGNRPTPAQQIGAERPLERRRPMNAFEKAKAKWAQEVPGLDHATMDGAITYFNSRKNNLVPLSNDPNDRVMPEVYMLKQRFPEFPADNVNKLRDILTYTWEQLQFLLDRFNTELTRVELEAEIAGVSPNEEKQIYLDRWKNQNTKIIDEGSLIVHKVECKEESINLGRLQHFINKQYQGDSPNNWCITRPGTDNMYNTYRGRRSYYFIMDTTKPQNDDFHLSVIQPIDPNNTSYNNEKPYTVTKRKNKGDDLEGLEWRRIAQLWPGLADKEHMFKFFGPTKKENVSAVLGRITFDGNGTTDFLFQDRAIQELYVNVGNNINSFRAFKGLSPDLQKKYILRTTRDNFKTRFVANDSSDPFAILKYITKNNMTSLDHQMKDVLGFVDGVKTIKNSIISLNYVPSYGDYVNQNLRLYESRNNAGLYGIMNVDNETWALPVKFTKTYSELYFDPNNDKESTNKYVVYTYAADDGDSFYLVMTFAHLSKKSSKPENFQKGRFIKKENIERALFRLQKLGK